MSIPLMKVPEYDLTLSNNVKIKYRPFLVKEQKLLLLSNENQNESEMVNILIDIVQACVKGDIDVKKLPVYDFEWLWLNIRSKSIGEVVNLKLKCPDDDTQVVDYELRIEDVKPDLNKKVNTKIEFTKDYGVVMRIPTIKEVANKRTILDMSINLMRDCIDQIYQGEELFEAKEIEKEELNEFLDNLTMTQFKKIKDYFDTLPIISHTIKYKNPKSGVEHNLLLQGATDFFQLPSYTKA